MLQPRYGKVFLFVVLKYLFFFIVLFTGKNYNPFTNHTMVLVMLMMIPVTIAAMMIIAIIYFYLFRFSNLVYLLCAAALLVLLEYMGYIVITENYWLDRYGLFNAIITVFFFAMFFFREIRSRRATVLQRL